ncbi:MAG: alpha/beta hydrolase family protein [Novosphingobium sp.]
MKAFAALSALALLGAATNPFAVTETRSFDQFSIRTLPAAKPVLTERYAATSPHQVGELRLPKGAGPFPVAMLVHGGCWTDGMGSMRDMGAMATWLTAHGVATWNVDYRALGAGGGWPGTFNDWAGALAHLSVLAKKYPLDLGRVSVIGHSAGATAVGLLVAGSKGDIKVPADLPRVRGAVILDGPSSLRSFVGPDILVCGDTVIVKLMGGNPDRVPARYAMVDPAQNGSLAKQLLMVTAVLPYDTRLVPAMKAKGVSAQQVTLDTESHFNLLAPGTRDFVAAAPALLRVTGGR